MTQKQEKKYAAFSNRPRMESKLICHNENCDEETLVKPKDWPKENKEVSLVCACGQELIIGKDETGWYWKPATISEFKL